MSGDDVSPEVVAALELDAEVFRRLRNWQERYRGGAAMLQAVHADLDAEHGEDAVNDSVGRIVRKLMQNM